MVVSSWLVQTKGNGGAGRAARVALGTLGVATVAMFSLHVVQRGLDPFQEPVSFYLHGEQGWLLPVSLACFGFAALIVAFALREMSPEGCGARSLGIFGTAMLLTAAVPSDRWFPWEASPTMAGIIHAAVAVIGPVFLLPPMFASVRPRDGQWRGVKLVLVGLYSAGLVGSALALVTGFSLGQPPPLIGVTERILALSSVGWLATMALGGPKRP